MTQCSGDICSTSYRVQWQIEVWGSCSPSDCYWGKVEGTRRSDGYVYGRYSFGWATKHVFAKIRPDGRLYGPVFTDFHDGRTDYWSTDTFRRI